MILVGGGDEGEGVNLGQEDVVPTDLWKLQLLLLRQQPEDLVKDRPPEFLEVPLGKSMISKCYITLTTDALT